MVRNIQQTNASNVMYTILITGDRLKADTKAEHEKLCELWYTIIYVALKEIRDQLLGTDKIFVIHGGANGIDKTSHKAAFRLGLNIHSYPALWSEYGRAAGPIRNRLMLRENPIDLVLAFHDNLKNSSGTKDMIDISLKAEKTVRHYKSDGTFIELKQLPLGV
jgi:hypothetical protein